MAYKDTTEYGFGQLGSVFNDGTAAIKPPLGKVFVAITFLADTKFDASGGLVGDNQTTHGLEYIGTEAAAHDAGAGNATTDTGEGGLQVDNDNVLSRGITIYGRWSEIDLASGRIIAYIGD